MIKTIFDWDEFAKAIIQYGYDKGFNIDGRSLNEWKGLIREEISEVFHEYRMRRDYVVISEKPMGVLPEMADVLMRLLEMRKYFFGRSKVTKTIARDLEGTIAYQGVPNWCEHMQYLLSTTSKPKGIPPDPNRFLHYQRPLKRGLVEMILLTIKQLEHRGRDFAREPSDFCMEKYEYNLGHEMMHGGRKI
jgi:hypothetical protein